jgi:hypothetical protein
VERAAYVNAKFETGTSQTLSFRGALALCPPYDSFRHCERSEAIHAAAQKKEWIASSLRFSQ